MNTVNETAPNKAINSGNEVLLMTDILWYLLVSALFAGKIYPATIERSAKILINSFLQEQDHYEAFSEFCHRVFMTRYYILQNPGYLFTNSVIHWLDPGNKHGFAGTAGWYNKLILKRKTKPGLLADLKAFTEAILDIAKDKSGENFQYWSGWFYEKNAVDQLLMIQRVGAQIGYTGEKKIMNDEWGEGLCGKS